ncbi:FtsK/SpoIIIE domain-containing protein [Streptomyces benahoarensis]|uniref:Cell division protein FtsK n=1 Tax=Streptomyces benahoarensis TaxID=2595054 RepID=A0A553ZQW0_9ACTN|nr:FtsK/SpoIIIE domain-containing protein [Streptomyces benahoarensis]TSB32823.1 cell division protein FtsK [Streptomyces benahoarensis]TSB43850.1 cell division protein FtsK [Streptomyces benahoarensis]
MPMMITIARHPDVSADVVVDADPHTVLREVVRELLAGVAPVPLGKTELPEVYLGAQRLDLAQPFGGSGIHDGSVLWLDQPGKGTRKRAGLVTVRAVAGTGAGQVWNLDAGEHRIGSHGSCQVRLGSDQPSEAAVIRVLLDATVQLSASVEGPLLDRAPLPGYEVAWQPRSQLRCGDTLLEAQPVQRPDAIIDPSPDGEYLDYNRPPRLLPPTKRTEFRLPAEPKAPTPSALPWLAATLPAVLGGVIALVSDNPMFLLMAAMSPVMMIGNWISGRRQGKVGHRRKIAEFQERRAETEREIAAALDEERLDRRAVSPDPGELLSIATGPRARLWERRRVDPDHLLVRVGIADLPTEIIVEEEAEGGRHRRDLRAAPDVPAAFSLAHAGVVGVAGHQEWPRRTARWLVGQLAVLQSPRDVQLYVLTDPEGERLWEWAAWLPHTRPQLGQQALALVGADAQTLGHRVAELIELINVRKQALLQAGAQAVLSDPDIVVVMDGARRLRALPGVVTILREGPAVGIYSICVDTDERTLPEECATVVVGGAAQPASLRQQRADQIDGILADDVADSWYEATGRRLAPLRDVSTNQGEAALPATARLLETIDLEDPDPATVAGRWRAGGRSTKAVVGTSLDGPFALDLVNHGPHGLVAGTTGSGKSEFLQTLVASLAVANRPDAMTFVLIDYKGGAAFKECIRLPHTVGLVTDLDPHLVERALTSLGAELTHRERLLAAAGAKDLEDYLDYATRRPGLAPIPRLLIVIDEFASMARELPDFVTGLVNVAQRGRSLGIHLILATQRPSGVVSAEIRANTNLRIALRVTDAGESTDVIDDREAANISASTPGRAYARLGHSSLIPFQTGRVGGRRPSANRAQEVVAPFLKPVSWLDLGLPAPQRPRVAGETDEATDLSVLVNSVRRAGEMLDIPQQRRPWLPPLPLSPVVELATDPVTGSGQDPAFSWAIQDLPTQQRQEPVTVDMATFGHLHIVGAPRSGRSAALRTFAAAAAAASSVADLHLYGLDCGNGALLSLSRLPHCGAVVQRTETDRAVRLLTRLHDEVQRRQRLLGESGFADVAEQRAARPAEERLPHIVLLLDRWEGFMGTLGEYDGGALTDLIQTLHREGGSAGVHLVIAGDRMLLSGRMSSLCEDKLVLRLSDRSDASLAGLNPRKIPENLPPGRGYVALNAVETQVALVAADPSGPAQVAAVHALADRLVEREAAVPKSARPNRIAVMPTELSFDQAWEMVDTPQQMWALVGVAGDELEPVGADLRGDQPTFLVAGPSRSGRSTALGVMTESLLRGGTEVVIGAPMNSPLRAFAGRAGVRGVLTDEQPTEKQFAELLDPGDGPVVLVVDDAEVWRDLICRDWLKTFVRKASGSNRGVIIGGDVATVGVGFAGWQSEIKKNRRGVLLSPPNMGDGDLVGVRLSRSQLAAKVVPGAGLLHLGSGALMTTQIPTAPRPGAATDDRRRQ